MAEKRIKSPFENLAPPGMKQPASAPPLEPPELALPRRHVIDESGDLPKTPRWKKILAGLFRVSTVAVPSVGAGYVAAQVQVMQQTQTTSQPQAQPAGEAVAISDAGQNIDTAQIEKLTPLLVVLVEGENAVAKHEETKSILQEACEFLKSMPIELMKDAVKETVKVAAVGAPLLALAKFLKRRSEQTGNKAITFAAGMAEKIAELFGKHPDKSAVTTQQLEQVFGDKALAAETMLLMLGYKKEGDQWMRAA